MPEMWIIAGPNGAGKTTLTREIFAGEVVDKTWVNPDDTTALLQTHYPDLAVEPERYAANLLAAQVSDGRLDHMIATGQSFVVETVLSSPKMCDRVARARTAGFTICMVYVALRSPDLAVHRVATRVRNKGHHVPEKAVRSRWKRSLQNLHHSTGPHVN